MVVMPLAHWGTRAVRGNLDETVFDAERPQAFPADRPADLMGRLRVRLRAEDGAIVAYGYGGQQITMPAESIGSVRTVSRYSTGSRAKSTALLVLDPEKRILLRAAGRWDTYGEVTRVCQAAGVPSPYHEAWPRSNAVTTRYMSASKRRAAQRARRRQPPPLYPKAPGYRRLRTAPFGLTARVLGVIAAFLLIVGLCGFLGALPAVFLPDWTGKVRVLIGIAGVALGLAGGVWLSAALAHVLVDGLRWMVASLEAKTPAPPGRFFQRRKPSGKWAALATAGLLFLVPAFIIWGPGLALVSGVNGISDSHLVADLRANGATTPGFLIDVPVYGTDSNGNTTVTDVATLSFRAEGQDWQDTDPSIGGQPLPLDPGDPGATNNPVTIVYDRGDPGTAAAQQQVTGSVWHGAPTANVVVGTIFTLLLPPLLWCLVIRIRRRKWMRAADMMDDFFDTVSR